MWTHWTWEMPKWILTFDPCPGNLKQHVSKLSRLFSAQERCSRCWDVPRCWRHHVRHHFCAKICYLCKKVGEFPKWFDPTRAGIAIKGGWRPFFPHLFVYNDCAYLMVFFSHIGFWCMFVKHRWILLRTRKVRKGPETAVTWFGLLGG